MKTSKKIFISIMIMGCTTLVSCVSCLIGLYLGHKRILEQYCHYQQATYVEITDESCCIKDNTIIRIPWLKSSGEK